MFKMEFELLKAAILLIVFGIFLPSFDTYSDFAFAYSLTSGTYEYHCDDTPGSSKISSYNMPLNPTHPNLTQSK